MKKTVHYLFLAAAVFLFIWIILPQEKLFGSTIDWYCQHVTIADTMRKQFLETGELMPDWCSLGSGTNFYTLSYYGFLRPDVLISFFFPDIPMEIFIQGYAILEMIAGSWLLYWWLQKKGIPESLCFTVGFLYLTSNCMFQAHRQIMFISYLPFLILALICVDRLLQENTSRSSRHFPVCTGLSLSICMIILHSFYFFPACFVCILLYFLQLDNRPEKRPWLPFLCSVTAGVSLSMVSLLPTALTILENKKDVKSASIREIFTVNPSLNTLLYSPYGCGLTLICLYCLLLCLFRKKTQKTAAVLCLLLCSQFCCWILNGTLYLRPKALIPFLPLILLLTADTLREIHEKSIRHRFPLALLCMIPGLIQILFLHSGRKILILTDILFLLVYAVSNHRPVERLAGIFLVFLIPSLIFVSTARTESYVSSSNQSREIFSSEEIKRVLSEDNNSALDILSAPMTNSNYLPAGNLRRTTMYSSVSNSAYNRLFYDILKMPVSTRNRVAMNADANPFQEYLMGVRYILTAKNKLPEGYFPLLQKGDYILAENRHVLPYAYGTTALLIEKTFDTLSYPQTLDTLANRTIVPEASDTSTTAYTSLMKEYPLPGDFLEAPESGQALTVTKHLPAVLEHQILLLSCDISYNGKKDIDITINGIRNRLSGSDAPYPNRNETFTWILSGNEPLKTLDIHFSQGDYKIHNIQAFTLPFSALAHPDIQPFRPSAVKEKELLHGSIAMSGDGYFVTSFSYSKGYQILVDGKKETPRMVNKGFLGFPVKKGTHEIVIRFHAPGKSIGILFSFAAAVFLILAKLSTLPLSSALRFPPDSRNNSYGVRPL